jgi:hypothetical protein
MVANNSDSLFLQLMKVLSNKEFNDTISWTPSGKSFSILKPKAFVADILPEHFKSAKFSSFTRKLHRWGFMRHYRGEDSGAFYHDDFQKDHLDLVEQMTCHKTEPPKAPVVKKTQPAAPNAPAAALPSKPAQRLVAPRAAVAPALPRPQSQEIIAQLQRQQQPLKLPVPEFQQQSQLDAAERLHAAIELEVTRRLQERIQAAAMSRHALAMIQQQQSNPLSAMNHRRLNFASPAASSLQAQLLRMQQEKKQRQAACMAYGNVPLRDKSGLGELPPTNIQGAKTA